MLKIRNDVDLKELEKYGLIEEEHLIYLQAINKQVEELGWNKED